MCTLALLSLKATNHSPGTLDNASGVDVLLELAQSLSSIQNPKVKVTVVVFGGGAGPAGIDGVI